MVFIAIALKEFFYALKKSLKIWISNHMTTKDHIFAYILTNIDNYL